MMKNKRKILLSVIIIILLLIIVFIFSRFITNKSYDVANEYKVKQDVIYRKPQLNLSANNVFTFKLNPKINNKLFEKKLLNTKKGALLSIYKDSQFRELANYTISGTSTKDFVPTGELKIIPTGKKTIYSVVNGKREYLQVRGENEWDFSDKYYIVQSYSLESGEKLKKSIVTAFTIKRDLDTPVVTQKLDNNGIMNFSWQPVSGAKKYYIVKNTMKTYKSNPERPFNEQSFIGESSKGQWLSNKEDYEESNKSSNLGVSSMNDNFKLYSTSDDDMHDKNSNLSDSLDSDFTEQISYGVIATDNHKFSSYQPIIDKTLHDELPCSVALNARNEMMKKRRDKNSSSVLGNIAVSNYNDIPKKMPVTMCNGKTVLRSVIVDIKASKLKNLSLGEISKKGKLKNLHKKKLYVQVNYKIKGTNFDGTILVEKFNKATYKKDINKVAQINLAARDLTGREQVYNYSTPKKTLDNVKISSTMPKSSFEIKATNQLTEYIAANMLQGESYINVKKFMVSDEMIDIHDAAFEALYQNPYIMGVEGINYIDGEKILEIKYKQNRKEQINQQSKTQIEVKKVVKEIIKANMNDLKKAQAINDYLVKSAEYDFDALNNSGYGDNSKGSLFYDSKKLNYAYTAYGILVKKKGVCASYAASFKLLADEVGLSAVVVNGIASGSPHAWNKVKIDGKWRIVDVTWNDGKRKNNSYFNLKDNDSLLKGRTQDDDFILDVYVSDFKTN